MLVNPEAVLAKSRNGAASRRTASVQCHTDIKLCAERVASNLRTDGQLLSWCEESCRLRLRDLTLPKRRYHCTQYFLRNPERFSCPT